MLQVTTPLGIQWLLSPDGPLSVITIYNCHHRWLKGHIMGCIPIWLHTNITNSTYVVLNNAQVPDCKLEVFSEDISHAVLWYI